MLTTQGYEASGIAIATCQSEIVRPEAYLTGLLGVATVTQQSAMLGLKACRDRDLAECDRRT